LPNRAKITFLIPFKHSTQLSIKVYRVIINIVLPPFSAVSATAYEVLFVSAKNIYLHCSRFWGWRAFLLWFVDLMLVYFFRLLLGAPFAWGWLLALVFKLFYCSRRSFVSKISLTYCFTYSHTRGFRTF